MNPLFVHEADKKDVTSADGSVMTVTYAKDANFWIGMAQSALVQQRASIGVPQVQRQQH